MEKVWKMNKIPVIFKKFIVTNHSFNKIKYCLKCGKYTLLDTGECPKCNRKGTLISIDEYLNKIIVNRNKINILFIILLFFLGIILSQNIKETVLLFATVVVSIGLLSVLYKKYKKSEKLIATESFFNKNHNIILRDINYDIDICKKSMEQNHYKEAYENLRDIGVLIQNDDIRTAKINCLNKFFIYKEMDLELDTLIVSYYNPSLVEYIADVAKNNIYLVTSQVIDYIIINEEKILSEIEDAEKKLGIIAGAILKSKKDVKTYYDFILRYVRFMPRDRLIRLCVILKDRESDNYDELYRETETTVRNYYGSDEAFREFFR